MSKRKKRNPRSGKNEPQTRRITIALSPNDVADPKAFIERVKAEIERATVEATGDNKSKARIASKQEFIQPMGLDQLETDVRLDVGNHLKGKQKRIEEASKNKPIGEGSPVTAVHADHEAIEQKVEAKRQTLVGWLQSGARFSREFAVDVIAKVVEKMLRGNPWD